MSKFQKFIDRFGWFGLIRLCFYPLTVLISTPIRLAQTLSACRVLADGKWDNYNRFTPKKGLNSLFYWTQALNLYRYGRRGISPYVGLGHYLLPKWFVYSLPSHYAYWRLAPIVPLVGLFGWLAVHALWVEQVNNLWALLVIGLALISTSFYANTFVYQNYNALGWLFFPIGLYGLLNESWIIAALAWLAASFASFTTVFVAGILSLAVAGSTLSLWPLLGMFPAGLKLLTHFGPALTQGNLKEAVIGVVKSIGMTKQKTKYKRQKQRLGVTQVYHLFLYLQFGLVLYFVTGQFSVLFLTGVGLFLLNTTLMRFADTQSIQMVMISLATALTIHSQEPWLLPSYWFIMSPLPLFMALPSSQPVLDVVPNYAPFSLKRLIAGMELFLQPVQQGQRVLMAFENPEGVYEKVFDGYRTLLELPSYVANVREIHFMPDWWAVFEANYEGAPEFWGRDVVSVEENLERWQADYAVVYQEAGTELEAKWREADFEVLSRFSWADYTEELRGTRPYRGPTPEWWLLRKSKGMK